MWRTFNCGIGFVLVVAQAQAAAVEAISNVWAWRIADRRSGRCDGAERLRSPEATAASRGRLVWLWRDRRWPMLTWQLALLDLRAQPRWRIRYRRYDLPVRRRKAHSAWNETTWRSLLHLLYACFASASLLGKVVLDVMSLCACSPAMLDGSRTLARSGVPRTEAAMPNAATRRVRAGTPCARASGSAAAFLSGRIACLGRGSNSGAGAIADGGSKPKSSACSRTSRPPALGTRAANRCAGPRRAFLPGSRGLRPLSWPMR